MNETLASALQAIARDGVEQVDPVAVEALARVIWHTDEPLPDLHALKGEFRDDAARMVARLAVFAIVAGPRNRALLSAAREVLGVESDDTVLGDERVDQAFVQRFWDQLSPLQTRQFAYDIGRPYA